MWVCLMQQYSWKSWHICAKMLQKKVSILWIGSKNIYLNVGEEEWKKKSKSVMKHHDNIIHTGSLEDFYQYTFP